MKYLIPIFFLILLSLGCKNTKPVSELEAEKVVVTAIDSTDIDETVAEVSGDSLAISFEKTQCFGRCPAYRVKVYNSGFATYEGINFTERMGWYSCEFSEEELQQIYEKALEINYFDLKEVYDDPLISDLPSTISKIQMEGRSHRIKARYNIPDAVKKFHDELAVKLMRGDWESYLQH